MPKRVGVVRSVSEKENLRQNNKPEEMIIKHVITQSSQKTVIKRKHIGLNKMTLAIMLKTFNILVRNHEQNVQDNYE